MKNEKTQKIVSAGLFTALTALATFIIKIPAGNGYLNPGDAVVMLAAFFLNPLWGAVSAGLGSALADLLAGWAVYAPATLVIKALMALIAGAVFRRAKGRRALVFAVLGGVLAEIIMVAGYFAYDAVIMGYGLAALADVPGNVFQGIFGACAGCALYFAMMKIPYVRDNF